MMDKFMVAVFDTEAAAYRGLDALKDLHAKGDVTLYGTAVIAKSADGAVELKQAVDQGPIGTATGLAIGALMGMLAGPAAVAGGAAAAGSAAAASIAAGGMASGSVIGGWAGMFGDLNKAGVDVTFLENVAKLLDPGKVALVAEGIEGWQVPVDEQLKAAGGTVFRKARIDVIDDQYMREAEALQAEWEEIAAEMDAAGEEAQAALKEQADAVKARAGALRDEIVARNRDMRDIADAKIKALNAQIEKAAAETGKKFSQRVEQIGNDMLEREKKLDEASRLIVEAYS